MKLTGSSLATTNKYFLAHFLVLRSLSYACQARSLRSFVLSAWPRGCDGPETDLISPYGRRCIRDGSERKSEPASEQETPCLKCLPELVNDEKFHDCSQALNHALLPHGRTDK